MDKVKFIRFITFALLFSVLQIAVPFHEILHIHQEQTHKAGHYTELHEYEKPCCKPVNYFHISAAILSKQEFVFTGLCFFHKESAYIGYHFQTVAHPSNKAPPVEIA